MPQAKASQPNEPRDWFYCMPHFRQAFAPVLNSASPYKNCVDSVPFDYRSPPKMSLDTQSAPKRFVDQEYETDVRSEMHEDTEELDAPLFSDDEDDYSEDEEEASTGH
ncbi:hypothetical protein AgCh_022079 [Apium graveolens]